MNGGRFKLSGFLCAQVFLLFVAALVADKAQGEEGVLIAAFGDSLSSGYGLAADEGFSPVLQRVLSQRGLTVSVINAAVAGDTSADALARVDWMLSFKPDIVLVEFGANDMLRGIPTTAVRDNLDEIILRIKASDARVLLSGMLAPRNLGKDYGRRFRQMYEKLRDKHDVPLYPFFLHGVALSPELTLPDGMHPNAKGVRKIAANIAPLVEAMLRP
ncbi:MAG: arylesterase [Candidatus Zeuxoniibacter abyssi]|nr:MAG: arylesterase [Candidatus Persebacteraceae bacterium AB1(2)]